MHRDFWVKLGFRGNGHAKEHLGYRWGLEENGHTKRLLG